MRFGVNTWVWTSPLTAEELEKLAPHVASLGFDWIEAPLEGLDDLDYRAGRGRSSGTTAWASAAAWPWARTVT